MNKQEHLMTVVIEECAEVQKEMSKILRLGLYNCSPNSSITNAANLLKEYYELITAMEMVMESCDIKLPSIVINDLKSDKRKRIEKYIDKAINEFKTIKE